MMKIPQVLKDYLAPGAEDAAYQEIARSLQFKRTTEATDEYPALWTFCAVRRSPRCGWERPPQKHLRRPFGRKMLPFPDPRNRWRRPARRGIREFLRRPAQRRRLFGPLVDAARQDVLAATDVDVNSNHDDFATSVAHRKAEKRKGERGREGGAKQRKSEWGTARATMELTRNGAREPMLLAL